MDFKDKKILILGMGLSGRQACRLALKHRAKVTLVDSRSEELMGNQVEAFKDKVEFVFDANKHALESFDRSFDFIVISPGVPPFTELGEFARGYPCPVLSELDFASAFIETPLITITGTNGKTTTVELLTHLLKEAGYKAESAGNIGLALSDIAFDGQYKGLDYVIVEASSYQLENLHFYSSEASAVLNISSDHCDRYEGETEYFLTKMKLFDVTKGASCFVGERLLAREDFPEEWKGRVNVVSSEQGRHLCSQGISQEMLAPHNLENLSTALSLGEAVGIEKEKLILGLASFKLSPHRIEVFGEKAGRVFVDDSKATNPDAVLQALKSFSKYEGKIRLVLGGVSKDMDFSTLPEGFSVLKKLYFYGRDGRSLQAGLASNFDSVFIEDFRACVLKALDESECGELILLSPACASFDQFSSYEERGECFKKLCLEYEF